MFRYGKTMFYLHSIRAAVNNELIISTFADPVKIDLVSQECSFTYGGQKVFLGDTVDKGILELRKGRLVAGGCDLSIKGGN